MKSYRVKNWRQFQHYSDRNPPWIKLHFSMLSSMDWVVLDDASRVLSVACMLIASRNEGVIPDNPDYIKRVAYLNKTPNFKPLIECGFLEDASGCKQAQAEFRPETETETETDKRTEAFELPDWVPFESWSAWLEVRKKVRAPNTPRALRMAVNELAKLRDQGEDADAVLRQAVVRGYRGLFPVKSAGPRDGAGVYARRGVM